MEREYGRPVKLLKKGGEKGNRTKTGNGKVKKGRGEVKWKKENTKKWRREKRLKTQKGRKKLLKGGVVG